MELTVLVALSSAHHAQLVRSFLINRLFSFNHVMARLCLRLDNDEPDPWLCAWDVLVGGQCQLHGT